MLELGNPQTKRILVIAGVGGAAVLVFSQQEVPYTHRSHAILVNAASECHMGAQAYEEILEEARRDGTLVPSNYPAVQRVARVGRRIAAVVEAGNGGGFQQHVKHLDWRFSVIQSPQVNAFVVPGGKVVVYTGTASSNGAGEGRACLSYRCSICNYCEL